MNDKSSFCWFEMVLIDAAFTFFFFSLLAHIFYSCSLFQLCNLNAFRAFCSRSLPLSLSHTVNFFFIFSFSYFRNALFHFVSFKHQVSSNTVHIVHRSKSILLEIPVLFFFLFSLSFSFALFLFSFFEKKKINKIAWLNRKKFFFIELEGVSFCFAFFGNFPSVVTLFFFFYFAFLFCSSLRPKFSSLKTNLVHEIPSHSKIGHYTTQNQHEQASVAVCGEQKKINNSTGTV